MNIKWDNVLPGNLILTISLFQQTRESWQMVFFIAAGVYAVGAILFCLLASGEVQPWAVKNQAQQLEIKVIENGSPNNRPIYRPRLSNGSLSTDPMLTQTEKV